MTVNLDDLRRLREEAMAAGTGTGRWIKCAQALMDAFPTYYETARAMNERLTAAGAAICQMKPVVVAAQEWSCERPVSDWADAALLKVLATFEGDRTEPCEGCDGECGEPCQPCTVAEMHAGIDRQTAALVEAGKLLQGTPLDAIYAEADRLGCRLHVRLLSVSTSPVVRSSSHALWPTHRCASRAAGCSRHRLHTPAIRPSPAPPRSPSSRTTRPRRRRWRCGHARRSRGHRPRTTAPTGGR